MAKHKCPNAYNGEGAKGGAYLQLSDFDCRDGEVRLEAGWSCVIVHQKPVPISWIAELIAIATAHKDGIVGFLREQEYGGPSWALMCDPPL